MNAAPRPSPMSVGEGEEAYRRMSCSDTNQRGAKMYLRDVPREENAESIAL